VALTTEEKRALLRPCELFTGLDEAALTRVAEHMREIAFSDGHYIVREGQAGTGFYVVMSGCVRVVRRGAKLAVRGPGEFFGELSILEHAPRAANVVADGPTVCLGLASWELAQFMDQYPDVAAILREEAQRRLESLHP
jgi:CRP-like cAMP-binding protein